MSVKHEGLLKRYLKLPERLEAAVAGLDETGLDRRNAGWSIRAYVHHTVEGELMWQLFLRAIVGRDGIEFPIQWYFGLPQEEWARSWAYDRRPVEPTLALFRASTRSLVELLKAMDPAAWEHTGRVTWPDDPAETRLSVRDILLIHLRHMDQHTADIRAIREAHNI
jgi:hypothetical protein